MNLVLSIVICCLVIRTTFSYDDRGVYHTCIHDEMEHLPNRRVSVSAKNDRRYAFSDDWEPLRIHIDTTFLDSNSDISAAQRNFLRDDIFPKAKTWLSDLLLTKRIQGTFRIERGCLTTWGNGKCQVPEPMQCGPTTGLEDIPVEHLEPLELCRVTDSDCTVEGGGLNDTDYIVYMMAKELDASKCLGEDSGVIAYASSCFVDGDTDRPVVGYTNICEKRMDETMSVYEQDKYVKVIVHEVFHALGFSASHFLNYQQHDGSPHNSSITETFDERGNNEVKKFITPKSVEIAREQLGCNTLNGLEIEDGGGGGTSGSHTEGRIFHNDLMNGAISAHPVISSVSLAVMHDSGWYKGNFHNAEVNLFGKDAGCDFASLKKCIENNAATHSHYCTTDNEVKCTANKKGIGYCILKTWDENIPAHFQYFAQPNVGSWYDTEDYCPVYQVISRQGADGAIVGDTDCLNVENEPSATTSYHGETYGAASACFVGNLYNMYIPGYDHFAEVGKCYQYECEKYPNGTLKAIKITVAGGFWGEFNDNELRCYIGENGLRKSMIGIWLGAITCPDDYSLYCSESPGDPYLEPDWYIKLYNWGLENIVLVSCIGGSVLIVVGFIVFGLLALWIICSTRRKNSRKNKIVPAGRRVSKQPVPKPKPKPKRRRKTTGGAKKTGATVKGGPKGKGGAPKGAASESGGIAKKGGAVSKGGASDNPKGGASTKPKEGATNTNKKKGAAPKKKVMPKPKGPRAIKF